ncbi:MAG: 2Fe-2S iron-sulfur cluster binding domain-containing protein [Novosphingobium sp.]|nr:2Fe-2S iron-sulfur cluster binding domain-containing protein [Novosphingobium sp.]MCP5389339.1 2Fe-2S iron-sulfur cluster binding domain-containing protein [Novosphingobium sp.]
MDDGAQVLFAFADGVERSVTVKSNETILDAGLAADLPLLFQCKSGSCSSCIAKLIEGETRQAAGHTTLLRSEYEAGLRLLCQCEAVGNCRLELGYDSEAGSVRATKAKAFVDEVEKIASNVVRLRLELAADNWVDFRSGQFFQLTVPGVGAIRSYSPATTPRELPMLEFLIRLLPGGVMSQWLTDQATPDDIIDIEGAFGAFFLREKVRAPHILIAGGTGLAPMLSIVDELRAQSGRKPPVLLSFGCTDPDALFGLDAIKLRQQWMPGLTARISVDNGATGDLLSGNPVDAVLAEDVSDPNTVAYLCGPSRMIDAAFARLEALGVNPDNIFAEQFVSSSETGSNP